MRKSLDLLDNVSVASPCHVDWDSMIGDEKARHCNQCDKSVYNLSEMTRQEATNFVRDREGKVCIRFYRRQDGTMLTADCPVGAEKRTTRKRRFAGAFASFASFFFFGCAKEQGPDDELPGDNRNLIQQILNQPEDHQCVMGDMIAPRGQMIQGGMAPPQINGVPPAGFAEPVPPEPKPAQDLPLRIERPEFK